MGQRYPTLAHSLQLIRHVNPGALKTIIDVGVQRETPFLMQHCADSFHHLFEPVSHYHSDLEANYRRHRIEFKLHGVALSDSDGHAYLHNYSEDGSGRITHSYLSFDEEDDRVAEKVSREIVPVSKLDTVFKAGQLREYEYLVKLDVDGIEEQIISGGERVMKHAAFVIIEASLGKRNLVSRLQLVESLGYRLFDIGDMAYYFGQMSQCDLVFINEGLRKKFLRFRPWEYVNYKVQWENWQHGFSELDSLPLANPYDGEKK